MNIVVFEYCWKCGDELVIYMINVFIFVGLFWNLVVVGYGFLL